MKSCVVLMDILSYNRYYLLIVRFTMGLMVMSNTSTYSVITFNLKELQAAFVSFKTRFGAAIALHIQESVNPTEWITEKAPEPHDVYWPFFTVSFIKRWISKLVVYVACAFITVLFLIPVAIVQGLTHLDQLEMWFPFLKGILRL